MKWWSMIWLAGPLLGACASAPRPATARLNLLPLPQSVVAERGRLDLAGQRIAGDRAAGERFAELMARGAGLELAFGAKGAIRFERTPGMARESYRLEVTPRGARVTASDDAGLFYGGVTLWQLATNGQGTTVPVVVIEDAPRFGWRGLMLDSARHYQSPAFVKQLIDWMAAHKLNMLHWHLVDDQGWRVEIKRYPRLTEVGAWRTPAHAPPAPTPPRYGGFYTQDQIREIVAYAAARAVTIVPEIDMPGHALAAIRAYPALGMGVTPPPGIESDWGVFPYLFNIEEPTFAFLEGVLEEVLALFPGRYVHVGGDEAVKDQWKASARVQARMRALGIADETALQGWFTNRIARWLEARGRRLIGWDEILEGGLPKGATVMSWRGIEGAVAAAKAGHDAVLSPAPVLYLDNRPSAVDPQPGRGKGITLAEVYAFDPLPATLTAEQQGHILGLQANLWTEHVRTEARAAYMAFPRASAVAERGWSATNDFGDFSRRLPAQLDRLAPLGLVAGPSASTPVKMSARRRDDTALELCSDALVLALEDDAPLDGARAVFKTNILNPCWIYRAAPMDGVTAIAVDVGQIPFNFQIGRDIEGIRFRSPATPAGEIEVRLGCEGPRIAVLPLAAARRNPAVTTVAASVAPLTGARDLCLTYTALGPDPMWAIDAVQLVTAP